MGNNLEPTCRCLDVIFAILMVLGGLMLFTLLIGNIQVIRILVIFSSSLPRIKQLTNVMGVKST